MHCKPGALVSAPNCLRCFGPPLTEDESVPPSGPDPVQPGVTSSRLSFVRWNTQGVREIIKLSIPLVYLYRQCHLISLVYNVISVKLHQEMCHRLIFLFQQHTHQHESLHSINSHSRPHFCALIGRHKLQVITTRFFTAETMGIYSSGFLFKLSAGESQSPAAYFPTISCTSALPPQIQQFHIQN